ncbi:hypothetical protein C1645_834753 [Glomus cerebriforme]|uniref:HIT domain-containing protein n=1 Tax=Glomus cerebriforme TaxID=658196 RepID=A0A397S916_9GLOM|nr:hypothetical protein C1645_834753 [Glomus cerebriforme]
MPKAQEYNNTMKNQRHHQNCPFCQWVKEKPKHTIEENQNYLSLVNISPDSEGHVLIITKAPRTNITELTSQDNLGTEGAARQTVFHFHLHVVPEREGNRGVGYLRKPRFIPSIESYQEIEKSLHTDQGVVKETDQVVVRLIDREQASDYGHMVIASKELDQNDLSQISEEVWNQVGEILQESVKKVEEQLNPGSLRTCLFLGKIGGLNEDSRFQVHLIPRYKSQVQEAKESIPIPSEVLEIAEKLRKADGEVKNDYGLCPECQQSYTG